MPTIIQDLKLKNDPTTIVHPNIESDNIPSSAITAVKIANATITSAKLASNAVSNAKIASSAVTETKIASGAVTSTKIASGAVTSAKIQSGAVQTSHFAPGAVDTNAIADHAVTASKLNIVFTPSSTILSLYPDLASFIAVAKNKLGIWRLIVEVADYNQETLFGTDGTRLFVSFYDPVTTNRKEEIITNDSDYTSFVTSLKLTIAEVQ